MCVIKSITTAVPVRSAQDVKRSRVDVVTQCSSLTIPTYPKPFIRRILLHAPGTAVTPYRIAVRNYIFIIGPINRYYLCVFHAFPIPLHIGGPRPSPNSTPSL